MRKWLLAAALLLYSFPVYADDAVTPVASSTSTTTTSPKVEKRFLRASSEALLIGWFIPWSFSHYIKDYDYANISMDTVRYNFENGMVYDTDAFEVNQKGHPFQGAIYFNAARINGFSFWESAPFVLVGDLGWEYLMEAEQPSYNDSVNTFLGGMSRGEITYRLSKSIIDNRASGSSRFWREIGAGLLNPVGFADRLVFGDMWKKSDNPPDRLPSKLWMKLDGGFSHDLKEPSHPNQGFVNLELRQNDPHRMPIKAPFDYYDVEATMAIGEGPLIPWTTIRGMLAGWTVAEKTGSHHMISPELTYVYFNNQTSAFGGQGLNVTLHSQWDMPNDFELRTEAGAQGFVFAGIQTDYTEESINATGRNYDYGSGGGPKFDLRLRKNDIDWLRASLQAGWFPTNNGISTQNRILVSNLEARYPVMKDVFAGVGWTFQERFTLYDKLPQSTHTSSIIKLFATWAFRLI